MNDRRFTIRTTSGDDWREVRDLRIEMLRDTPMAFGETLADALARDESEWRIRGERGRAEHGTALAAITNSGRWIGTMGGYVPDAVTGPLLVGVYVAPDFRGVRGADASNTVVDALLAEVERWARTEGTSLTLHVHEDNLRAVHAYENRGYVATGVTVPYVLDASSDELEMRKSL